MSGPKLEIVRDEDTVAVWIGGKSVMDHTGHVNRLDLIERTACAVADALGADVEHTNDPSRQPYRYFLAFVGTNGRFHGTYNAFVEVPDAIEDLDTMRAALDCALTAFAREGTRITNTAVTNFILIDGPC